MYMLNCVHVEEECIHWITPVYAHVSSCIQQHTYTPLHTSLTTSTHILLEHNAVHVHLPVNVWCTHAYNIPCTLSSLQPVSLPHHNYSCLHTSTHCTHNSAWYWMHSLIVDVHTMCATCTHIHTQSTCMVMYVLCPLLQCILGLDATHNHTHVLIFVAQCPHTSMSL